MKKFILGSIIALFSISVTAQGKYGATPEDSVNCIQNLSLYRDYYKQKVYDEAYTYWKVVFNICPASSERMYVDGASLLSKRIKAAENAETKSAYIDTLMMLYDQRIANFGKECYVLGRKGTDMLRYRSKDLEAAYATLDKSVSSCGNKTEAGTIVSYMNATVLMEKAGKKSSEDVVTAFSTLSGVVSANKGSKSEKYYAKAQESIEKLAGPYLSCDVLVPMYNDGYESKKEDQAWMERAANLLNAKGCTDAPIFFTIAQKLHSENPSANSAEKMGILSLKKKKYQEAANYFNQAVELAENDEDKSTYYIELAQAYSSMGSYSSARTNARKAAQLKDGFGLPYILIGDMIAGSSSSCKDSDPCMQKAIYWLATDYYNKAKAVDPSMASKANGKIASIKKYYPTKEDCFFKGIKEGQEVAIGCWIGESTKARF